MSELLNKYTELHDEFIDALVQYHSLRLEFLDRQSPRRTANLRKVLKRLRLVIKAMEKIVQERMHERRIEWGATHRVKKEKENE
jgi:hypothetical protein